MDKRRGWGKGLAVLGAAAIASGAAWAAAGMGGEGCMHAGEAKPEAHACMHAPDGQAAQPRGGHGMGGMPGMGRMHGKDGAAGMGGMHGMGRMNAMHGKPGMQGPAGEGGHRGPGHEGAHGKAGAGCHG